MNILIPHTWLLEHLETQADPKTIQEKVSLCGPSIEQIYEREGDSVYDIEVTTNRVDSMSVRGIAREAAVILSNFDIPAKLKPLNIPQPTKDTHYPTLPLPIIHNNPKLNRRTMCVILADVKHTPTPNWMAQRLTQTDMNVHDSVIDITNHVTHELGHPCHAFDYDKVMATGGEIFIAEAQKGEKFVTLDGIEFETVGGEVVFKNGQGQIIDLPSIKGTANTSVDDQTKNVLLLEESIRADKVRFASMSHAIRTTAAQLMEKNVDPHLAEPVLKRGIELYTEICEAHQASDIYDDFFDQNPPAIIITPKKIIDTYLGIRLDPPQIAQILTQLECQVTIDNNNIFKVTPPSFRPDLHIPVDIVEEIARIYGYHKLPSQIMATQIPLSHQADVDFELEKTLKNFMSALGWQEVYTYSLVSQEIALQSGYSIDQHLKILNPLTEDRIYLRRSLVPSLLEILDQNPLTTQLSVFELANIYLPQSQTVPIHELHLTFVSSNKLRHSKGDLESLFAKLYITDYRFEQTSETKASILVTKDGQNFPVGVLIRESITRYSIDLVLSALMTVAKKHPQFQPISHTALLTEDFTFTLPEKTLIGPFIADIQAISHLIAKVELKDIYHQNFSFTLHFLDPLRNLSAEDVAPLRKQIVEQLRHKYQAELVGKL